MKSSKTQNKTASIVQDRNNVAHRFQKPLIGDRSHPQLHCAQSLVVLQAAHALDATTFQKQPAPYLPASA
jgi:hypothetical protein